MIRYPLLEKDKNMAITAPSSGIPKELHSMFILACNRMMVRGYSLKIGETVWTQNKAKSAPAWVRGEEFNRLMMDESVSIILPPWGGELLIEILEYVDFAQMQEKWIVGYSDTSLLSLAVTLQTGIATVHGPNLVDLRGEQWDDTTAMWERVVSLKPDQSIVQYSSKLFQKEWQHHNPTSCVFHLTEQTYWKSVQPTPVKIKGRLLGGCIDVIRHLAGTPFGNIQTFKERYIQHDQIIWYFENCELSVTDLRRSLVQLKLAGWFTDCSGIMFGRSPANQSVGNYTAQDAYEDLAEELQIPIVYDLDFGHVPPQMTLVNGAFAEVEVDNGVGVVVQYFV
ncbi:peptidase S66 [Bacillus coahuilensis m2-6]|uniref:S66 family peptidase n=1 Tax=Bacillus coahuilensis TaxID=408580 RepID=UPI0001850CDF|nr:S66 peptidase family protein [Bacillus coahuilensis]KUP08782.1 peptidase S66 [Bacillus coahuilensis m2-6]